jgi:glucan phosphoethanolaminetransferase (alkaline phosphatase superfamily)
VWRLAVTLIAVILVALIIAYYGVQVEALAVQIETSIEQALAQVSISMVAFMAFVGLAIILLLRLLIGRTRSL